jgi:multiple sugar transport system substrate-binding protein
MKKRWVLLLAICILSLYTVVGVSSAVDAAEVDWRQASGSQLVVGAVKHAYADALKELVPEFEKLTGIKVLMEIYSQDEFMNKRLIDLSSGAGTFDVVMIDQAIVQYARAGWIEPLDTYFADSKLIDINQYDMTDFLPSMIKEGKVDGKLYGLPVTAAVQMLFYRKDVLEENGLKVPETFDELYNTAVAINKPGEMAGMLLRGEKIHCAWSSVGFVWAYGGRIFDDPNNPKKSMFNSPQAAEGITMYAKLLQDAGPRGVGNYTWYEALADFQQGKAAMYIDNAPFMSQIEDPNKSKVAGKVGYAPMPSGPAGAFPNTLAWMLGMSSSSKNKEAAFVFLSWATSRDTTLKIGDIAGTSARESFYTSDTVKRKYPADWAETFVTSMKNVNPEPGFPLVTEIDEWLDIYGGAVNATILKQADAQTNLNKAAANMDRILE